MLSNRRLSSSRSLYAVFLVVAVLLVGAVLAPVSSAQEGQGGAADVVTDLIEPGSRYGNMTMALGADDIAVIATTGEDDRLKVIRCTNPSCEGEQTSTSPDGDRQTGASISLAIDADGNPAIAYTKYTPGAKELRLLRCTTADCSGPQTPLTIAVDDDEGLQDTTSLVLDAAGNPVIVTETDRGLLLAHCDNAECSGTQQWVLLDPWGAQRGHGKTALSLDSQGNPVVAYGRWTREFGVLVIKCSNADCKGPQTIQRPFKTRNHVGYVAMALDSQDRPAITFHVPNTRTPAINVLRCTNTDCSGNQQHTKIEQSRLTYNSSITLDVDDNPVIAYPEYAVHLGGLRVVHCSNQTCDGPQEVVVAEYSDKGFVGQRPTIALDSNGDPFIAYASSVIQSRHCVGGCDDTPIVPAACGDMEGANLIIGTYRDDRLAGTPGDDIIIGLNGRDRIRAGAGNDCVLAGGGPDIVRGGKGADRIFGEGKDDRLLGGSGNDFIDGGAGSDLCSKTSKNCEETKR